MIDSLTTMPYNDDLCEALQLTISSKLKYRNNLIKMTEKSPVGQNVVQKYKVDPIASDSDNGKKIR